MFEVPENTKKLLIKKINILEYTFYYTLEHYKKKFSLIKLSKKIYLIWKKNLNKVFFTSEE